MIGYPNRPTDKQRYLRCTYHWNEFDLPLDGVCELFLHEVEEGGAHACCQLTKSSSKYTRLKELSS